MVGHVPDCHSIPGASLLSTKRVGRALGVPANVSVEEVLLIIEGKLREMECDPANVQVVVGSAGMSLCGEDGEFLSITELPLIETPNDD